MVNLNWLRAENLRTTSRNLTRKHLINEVDGLLELLRLVDARDDLQWSHRNIIIYRDLNALSLRSHDTLCWCTTGNLLILVGIHGFTFDRLLGLQEAERGFIVRLKSLALHRRLGGVALLLVLTV